MQAPPTPNRSGVAVVGMGNILYRDEGVGIYAVHHLRAAYRFRPAIELVDGAMLGFALMDYFHAGTRLLVLDTLLTDDEPGAVYRLPAEELLRLGPDTQPMAHEVDPVQQLKLATALGDPLDLALVGMVPADMSGLAVGLSPQLRAAFPAFIDAVLAELRQRGIHADRIRSVPLDEVAVGLVEGAR